jgi:25S rRNA (adenine2142-N1)-methyltransferase
MTSATKPKRKSKKLLSSSRPGISSQPNTSNLSSRTTRTIIRTHHTLQKNLHKAKANGDNALAISIQSQINDLGGLKAYQNASIQGQSVQRGGDSSKVLMQWLEEVLPSAMSPIASTKHNKPSLRLLEVGALSPSNACSTSGVFDVERIDLHSQHKSILEQDFMLRPLPANDLERCEKGFDVISLSLVVNYVPEARIRGEMLKRTTLFLRNAPKRGESDALHNGCDWFPGLFLVLPAPCVTNSRYLDEQRLEEMMQTLGFKVERKKLSTKLVYYYFKYKHVIKSEVRAFGKRELRKGSQRNNFAIVIE